MLHWIVVVILRNDGSYNLYSGLIVAKMFHSFLKIFEYWNVFIVQYVLFKPKTSYQVPSLKWIKNFAICDFVMKAICVSDPTLSVALLPSLHSIFQFTKMCYFVSTPFLNGQSWTCFICSALKAVELNTECSQSFLHFICSCFCKLWYLRLHFKPNMLCIYHNFHILRVHIFLFLCGYEICWLNFIQMLLSIFNLTLNSVLGWTLF